MKKNKEKKENEKQDIIFNFKQKTNNQN